jgi:hypothetical protein
MSEKRRVPRGKHREELMRIVVKILLSTVKEMLFSSGI